MTFGRKPLTFVEIDVDRCTRTYGVAPCTAALSADTPCKCFNSWRTCQDQANYEESPTPLTLRFSHAQADLPKSGTIFTTLESISDTPIEVNLAGIDPRSGPLGIRAQVTAEFSDFTYHDTLTDPYQAERVSGAAQFDGVGYRPKERGTFFGRLARRYYLTGRPFRHLRGYAGQTYAEMEVSHWFISSVSGPDAGGRVGVSASDVLNLVTGKRVQAPELSRGVLVDDMTDVALSFTLTPTGIGDTEYPASGRVRIGREVMTFTRSGDAMTVTTRGVDGTEVSTHKAGDTVQRCLRYEDETMDAILIDLLTVEGPVPASYIDASAWADEVLEWSPSTFTATISEPTDLSLLVGELAMHGAILWWDQFAPEILLRANRPKLPDENFIPLTDAGNLIEGTIEVANAEDQRISAIMFWHGMNDVTESATEARTYDRPYVVVDPSSSSAREYNEARIKKLYSRWFGEAGNDAAVSVISDRLISRYRDAPRLVTGWLDVKDAAEVKIGALVQVQSRVLQDPTGAPEVVTMQVNHVKRSGDRLMFRAEEYRIDLRFGFWMDETLDEMDYDAATDAQKAQGAWWFDDTQPDFGDGTGPYLWF